VSGCTLAWWVLYEERDLEEVKHSGHIIPHFPFKATRGQVRRFTVIEGITEDIFANWEKKKTEIFFKIVKRKRKFKIWEKKYFPSKKVVPSCPHTFRVNLSLSR